MKIGLFFGSFNPIHNGHLIIAEHVANFFTDEIWFVVSPQNPFKKNTDLLKTESRILLARAAITGNAKFSVSDVELNLPTPSYTIDTLKYLNSIYNEFEFFLVIGSDNFKNISNWKSGNVLIEKYNVIVYERPGFIIGLKEFNSNIIFIKAPLINISSTEIRQLISTRKSIRYLVPSGVESLIREYDYYSQT